MAGRGRGALIRSALRRPGSAEKVLVVDLIISNIIIKECIDLRNSKGQN